MKKLRFLLFAIVAIVSCSKEGGLDNGGGNNNQGDPTTSAITLNKSYVIFDESANEEIISFSASENWIAEVVNESKTEWLSVSPTSGKSGVAYITIKAKDNDTSNERSASVCIKAGSVKKTINVTQKQQDVLTVTSSKFEVPSEGGEITVEVKANVDFEYTIDNSAIDWISYKTTRALKTTNLVFDIKDNNDMEKRQGKITIDSGVLNEEIIISQAGKTIEAGTIYVEVSCNQSTLFNHIYYSNSELSSIVASIQQKDNGYLITLNKDCDEIPYGAFQNCSWLESIIIGCGIKSIGNYAFQGSYVNNVTIPDSVFSIGKFAFDSCSFTSIILPDNVTTISLGTFNNCKNLKSVMFGSGVTSIERYAFAGCGFTSITIPNNITSIGDLAFEYCRSLTSVTIPKRREISIGIGIFSRCYNLSAFYGEYASLDNRCLIVQDVLYSFAPSELETYTIPNGVKSIGNGAFYNSKLKDVFIPNSVTSIGEAAFHCCEIKEVYIPDSVITIGESAFCGCELRSISIPNSVTLIGDGAFENCKAIETVEIPNSVTRIGGSAFASCGALKSVSIGCGVTEIGKGAFNMSDKITGITCLPTTPPEIEDPALSLGTNNRNLSIDVPDKAIEAYENAPGWNHYKIH